MADRAKSSCLPPWLESITPAHPYSMAWTASSAVATPFSTIFMSVIDLNHSRSSQLRLGSMNVVRAW